MCSHIKLLFLRTVGMVCLAILATPGLVWAQQVEVNVEGDYPQLQDNAEAFLVRSRGVALEA